MKFPSPEARQIFLEHTLKHADAIYSIELWETKNQRGWFEGGLIPLITYYQEGMDYHDSDDNKKVREWLKMEFNPEIVSINGKSHILAGSTKGELNNGFTERVMDWMIDQGYEVQYLNPDVYKDWRDRIKVLEGGPDNYIDWLIATKKIN